MNASESSVAEQNRIITLAAIFEHTIAAVGAMYCRCFHEAISRPVNGKYRCWRCLKEFQLEWR
jgi:hypothetical protein